jgi:hypothetical protein
MTMIERGASAQPQFCYQARLAHCPPSGGLPAVESGMGGEEDRPHRVTPPPGQFETYCVKNQSCLGFGVSNVLRYK